MTINGIPDDEVEWITETGLVHDECVARFVAAVRAGEVVGRPSERGPDGRRVFWQLSFASGGWRGGYVAAADTIIDALALAVAGDHYPGGQVMGVGFRARAVMDGYVGRLLTDRDEVRDMPEPVDAVPL